MRTKNVRTVFALAVSASTIVMSAVVMTPVAEAAVVNPLTVQYDQSVFGDFTIAGNVVTTCPTSALWANANCAVGRSSNSSALATTYINDAFYMEYVDVDGDASTFNSSTARITIPPGASIDYARLWWVGNTGASVRTTGTPWFSCNASQPNTASPNQATAPPGFTNVPFTPSTHPIKVKFGAGAYQSLTPEAGRYYQDAAATNGGRHYAASQDIKSLLAAQPTGVPLDLTVGNIWTPKGNNCTGGFAITYVYKYADPDVTYAPQARQVLIFDGFVAQGKADPATTTNLTGFTLASGTRRFGAGVIEGDQGIPGDQLIANGTALADTRITPTVTNNYFASTVDGAQNPIYPNTYGLDAKTRDVPASVLPNGLTSVPLTFTTSGDQYFPFLFAFSAPVVTNFISGLVWNDANGNGVLDPGEAPIAGTTITVTGTDVNGASVTRTTTTDAGGGYRVDGLLNGTYTVTETQPTAYSNSPGTTTTQYVSNTRTGLVFTGNVAQGKTNVNFAEIQSSIAGVVYYDQNADGTKGAAEPGIGGVTVHLTGTDVNGAPVGLTTTTAADGSYKFPNLAAGTYVVTEVQPTAYGDGAESVGTSGGTAPTNDKIQAIALAAGANATGYNFGEKLAPLSGKVYVDTNNDGTQGAVATEPGIAGVTITVTGTTESGAAVNVSTTTAADGSWSFPNLLPGTYTITETQPSAYGDGIDSTGTANGAVTGTKANDEFSTVVLTGAGPGVNYNFGEVPGSIGGRVWYDADKDGVLDATETFIAGVVVTLTKPDGTTLSATTAADGSYSFPGLPAGSYTITETQPTGYGTSTSNLISAVTLPAGGTVTNQNFGETLGSISGKVYIDGNSSGSFTAGEFGIPNATVTLKNAAGAVIATTTTDSTGNYTFAGLLAGTYSVVETQPAFVTDAAETAGSAGGNVAVNDTISAIVLGAGVDATGNNFGELGANISGKVYADVNNNGVIDVGESGIAGVAMALEARLCVNALGATFLPLAGGGCSGTQTIQWVPYDTTTTGADGSYVFLGNDPVLVYRVVETQPTTYSDGIDTPGTNGSVQANDILQIGTLNYATTLGAGGSVNNNFGELAGEISGYVYADTNNDGLRTGDAAIAGTLITVTDGVTTWTAVTDATGFYKIVGLPISAAGKAYTITETQPTTYFDGKEASTGTINPGGVNDRISVTLTTAARVKAENNFGELLGTISGKVWYDANGNGTLDPAETTGIPTTITITNGAGLTVWTGPTNADGTYTSAPLPPGNYTVTETQPAGYGSSTSNTVAVNLNTTAVTGVNFGETLGSIAGAVYADTNRNGVRDPGEPAISGVAVTLTGGPAPVTVNTDVNGNYLFTGLPAANYTITEAQPALYNDGSEALGTTGGTMTGPDSFTAVSLDPGEDAVGYLFGELSPSVSGVVYVDQNRNGLQDPGEPGIPGIVMTLTGPGGVNLTTTTDITGNYLFPSVPVGGGYTLTETQPPGYGSSQQPTNSITALNVPLAGVTNQNFGDTLSTIAGTVYIDGNGNGVQDPGEKGIAGATVSVSGLDAAGQSISRTMTTDANGDYKFTGLLAGTYSVSENQPAGFDDGKDAVGTVTAGASGAQDSFDTPDRFAGVVLATTDDGINYDFGEIGTSIAGTVFRDKAKNGVLDPGTDVGLPGVTVELYDATGLILLATTTTAVDGSYKFPNLSIGSYVVKEIQPVGYGDTIGAAGPNTRTVAAPAGGIGGIDFGETLASIGGTVWLDTNANGVRDGTGDPIVPPTDAGIPGVTITLRDAGGAVVATTVTDAKGEYFFDNLAPGTYSVTETQPASYGDGVDKVGSLGGSAAVNEVLSGIILGPGSVGTDYDFAEIGAKVSGTVFVDPDLNGIIGATEPTRIAGVTITLDDGNPVTVDPTTTTDATGYYEFVGVAVGAYTIVETQPAGYASTLPVDDELAITVAKDAGGIIQSVLDQNFGEVLGTIGDVIWNDRNGNGIQDLGEPGIPGVKVTGTVTIAGVPTTFTATTDATGTYHLVDLPLGTYAVAVDTTTLPAGMTQTGDPDATKDNASTVTLTPANLSSTVQDFGYQGAGSIGNFIWNDLNGDGVQDVGEPGIPGVKVTLTTTIAGSLVTYTAITDATGAYTAAGLPLGDYTVAVDSTTLPAGLTQTFDNDGLGTANSSTVTLTVATPAVTTQDFGYQGAGSIGNFVWTDLNGDGIQDPGEPGIPGVTVTITTTIAGSPVTFATTTNATGGYGVAGLPLGDFTVAINPVSLPAGVAPTFDADGTTTANTSAVTLTAALATSDTQDFGYRGPGTIGDTIWNDLDGDGIQDPGEPGLPGVKVTATLTAGVFSVVYTATTGPDGTYQFTQMPLGAYSVAVDATTLQAGMTQTGDPDTTKDGTSAVTLTVAAPASDVQDFGYQGPGRIGDFIWNDLDGDGAQDPGEPGIPGVKVTITTTIAGAPITYTATTDATGKYLVEGVPLGAYTVTVDPTTLPLGVLPTGDADGVTTPHTSAITLTAAAPASLIQDFAYQGPGSIGDFVWIDINGDGVQDAGESGIPGVKVTITTTVGGASVTYSATTGPDGKYLVSGLPLGTYTVTVDPTTLPAGMLPTFDANGTATPHTSSTTLTAAAPAVVDQDFGYEGPGVIGDLIWNDLDGDGVQDPGEPGIPGVTVTVTATIGGTPVSFTTTTGPEGTYEFTGLPLGTWTVAVDATTVPAGMTNTGDPDTTKDGSSTVTLTAAAPTSDVQDFGYQGPGSIGNFVWIDVNADGIQDPAEPGLAGVTITITTTIAGSPVTYTTTTDSNGGYTVAGLPLGAFTVTVDSASLPAGITQTFDADGVATANTSAVTLSAAAPTADTQDFGYQGPGKIGDKIWNDLDGDGFQDPGEPGIPGVTVTATATVGGATITVSAVTGPDGSYLIAGLPLATFTVKVDSTTLPGGGMLQTGDPDATKDHTSTVTLTAAVPASDTQDFGYRGPGSIGNLIWNDLNGDGIVDLGEPGIPGVKVTVTVTIAGTPITYSAVTDASGAYNITGLPLGDYTVMVDETTVPPGMTNTGDPDAIKDGASTVTLSLLSPHSPVQDFGYQGPGAIGNFIWNDLNADGVQDAGEPGLPGVDVTITTTIGGATVTYTATTDAAGGYNVTGLPLGDFTVTVNPSTLPDGAVPSFDADGTGTVNTSAVTLTAAAPTSDTQDFGYAGPGVIGDLIWNDLDGDGIADPGEPGIPGLTVTITTTINGQSVTYTDVTDASGAYLVSGLPLGAYTVTVNPAALPAGLTQTGDPDATKDNTSAVTLTAAALSSDVQDFGYQGPGSIGDRIWNDLNGDGIQDPGEPGLPGIKVTVTTTINGLPVVYSAITGPTGAYLIDGLPLGDYTVTVDTATLPAGVTNTGDPDGGNDNASTVTLTAAAPTSAVQDFGYQGLGAIGNLVWIDTNGDGIVDAGEPGIPGVTVTITTTINGSIVLYSATTDATGTYNVTGLPLGSFTVAVDPATLPTGATPTFDADGTGTAHTSIVDLTAAAPTSDTQDFGYRGPGHIGDLIWNDLNGDGIVDPGEPGIPGVTVRVNATVNGLPVTLTVTTGPDGTYSFDGLPLGSWTVTVDPATLPAGVLATGDPDSIKDGTSTVTLTAAAPTSDTQDFGYQGPGVIGDRIWNDLNGDGIQDPGEPGVPGVTVTITTTIGGAPVTYTAVTDTDGMYLVDGLALGDFTVIVDPATLPAGVLPTGDPDGGNDNTAAVTLTAAAPTSDIQDFGYQGPGSIGNFVWVDLNGDGVQDPGEPGIPGASVRITATVGGELVTYTTTTDATGGYTIAGLPLGDYTVAVIPASLPAGMVETFDADGIATADTSVVTLTAAAPASDTQDFGYRGPGTIGDLIWNDLNGDGIVDPGEPGIAGVTLTATLGVGVDSITATTVTGPDGSYTFTGLPLGPWTVTVDPATLPAGVVQTGDPDATNDNTATVTLTAATPTSDTQDFGYQGPGSIGDLIWNDLNGDGIIDLGEPGIPGVTVRVTTSVGGVPVTYTAVTDATGAYLIEGLPLGDFTVVIDPATLPAGVLPTGDPDGGNDNTSAVTLTAAAPTSDTQDFGYQGPGSIGNFVWIDINGDGVQDAGEPGVAGVAITITTTMAGSPVVYTTTTDAAGAYTVAGLPLGSFTVAVTAATLPTGVVPTFDADGIATANTSVVALTAAAPTSDTQDFGYQGPGEIGDLIWNDLDGDGIVDPGEPGLPGVTVTVTTTIAGTPITLTTTTGPDGSYTFPGLPLGDWTVTVDPTTLPAGVLPTGDPDGGDDNTSAVTLTAATPTSDGQDFGYQGPGAIGDLIWNDLNGDGIADPGEPGIPGVDVTITTTIGGTTVTYTTTTDAAGNYDFTGLPLGGYRVVVDPATLPAGVLPTGDPDGGNDNTSAVTLTAATPTSDTQDFGYQGPGSIGDRLWIDVDGDGAQDAGEPGIAGVSVTITTVVDGTTLTYMTITDATGDYTVTGLPLGAFTVTVDPATLPAGVDQTFDADGIGTANTSAVTLTAATPAVTDQDFGYQGPGVIGDLIWNDLDGDGIADPGEPGIPGVIVTITTTIGGSPVTLTTTTGPDGAYTFDGLPLGDWTVTVDPASLPAGLTVTGDPDATKDGTSVVTLTAAAPTSDGQDFGYQGVGAIGNFVWTDLNSDGVQDSGEPGIAGVTVTITTTIAGSPVTYTATTDANGAYDVTGLPLGDFTVATDTATLPSGVTQTFDADGIATPNTSAVSLTAAAPTSDTQDFGYAGPGSIGDKVWNDLDGDGFQDPNEPGIPGVTITATATIGGATFTVTTVTDPDGTYLLDGLPLATFTVTVDPATLPGGVVATGDPDAVKDGISTVTLTVASPMSDEQDFGYQGPGEIGDLIWNDLDGDGIVDPGEPGIPGVTVTISTTIAGSPVTYTTTTGPDGSYSVTGLPFGAFTVTVDPATLPAGVLPTGDPDGGNDHTSAVTLTAATPTSDTQDFGYQGPGAIGDLIWNDLDGDGIADAGEPGIPGATVMITTTIAGSPVTYTTITGPDGAYIVTGLPLGAFTVTVDPTTLPGPMVQTYDADGTGTANTSSVTLTAATPTVDTQDFGYTGNGVIGDLIWNDLDGDGIADPGEPGLPGVTVTVTTVINGETVTYTDVTDASGAYLIAGLPLGNYTVTVDPADLPAGLTQTGDPDATNDNASTVTLTAAAPSSDVQDFGYQGPGVIGDLIWNDLNGDGIIDPGEPGIPGVTVTITATINGSPVTYTAVTGPTGAYEISGLPLGDFTVTVDPTTLPPGVLPTGDPDGGNDHTAVVTLTAAAPTSDTQDFGYQGPGSIGDLIWVDLDADGTQDPGEPGIPGVTVTITTTINGSIVLYSATTDASGGYTVVGLPLGAFTVAVDPATLPDGVTPTFDADGTGTANTSAVTLTAAAPANDAQDFGYRGPGMIGDLIWNDLDGDGIVDPGEPGLPGVKVTATAVIDGVPVTVSTVTGPDGTYTLAGIPLGEWTLAVDPTTLPPGVAPTGDPDGGNDNTAVVTLTAATPTSDAQDFGYQGPGAIGDLIWNDLNGNGVAEVGEPGIPGVTVTITMTIAGSPVTYTTTTGPDGSYTIDGLPLGAFTVTVDPTDIPAGLNPTSDPDGGADHTSAVTLTAAAPTSDTQDFGYTGPGVIGDLIWNDLDGDGTQDPGEPGIPGVTITITTTINGSPVIYATTTAPDGSYSVTGLPLGAYTVTVDPSTLPPGAVPTGDPDGTNDSTSTLTLTAAVPTSDTQDFGYQGPGAIGDLIWNDQNGDGIRDPGEPGLPGVKIAITTTIAGQPVTYTTTTGPDGTYSVVGLPLGDFTVTVDPATLPVGVLPTGDPDGGNDHTATVTLTAATPTTDTQDFGYQGPGAIGNLVWSDLNSDGIQDPDEPGIGGVDITITTTIAGATVTYTTTTGPDGMYSVVGLPLGDYTVKLDPTDLPAGSLPTGDADGLATPNVSVATLTALTPTTDLQDFGQHLPARIGDLIWNDLNGNGLHDAGEPGIGGVTVHLTGTDGFGQPVDLTAVTSETGEYLFSNLVPGVYTITVTPPTGYAVTATQEGTDRELDSNGLTTTLTLTSGMGALGVDTGLFIPANISGKVYADLDASGSPGPTDPGIPGVTVTLTGTDGRGQAITLTTTTGPDGTFQFPNLPPGSYTVTETQPPAWSDGTDTPPDGTTSTTNDVITQITVTSGKPVTNLLFGEQGWPVTGKVTLDGTGSPVPGVTLTLRGTDVLGNPVERTVVTKSCNATNATDCVDGTYEFVNVPPGTYTLVESQPPGLGQGTVEPTDSVEIVVSGGPVTGKDFSEKTSSVSGVVYIDVNNNGVHDAGEAINPGVTITLTGTDVNGKPVSLTTTSAADGTWSFTNLHAGDYTITQTQPASLNDGATTAGSAGGTVAPNVIKVQLAAGVAATNYLFGDVPKSQAGQLPKTGGSPVAPLGVALMISLFGVGLIALGRRRRSALLVDG